jgi:hypothetical protein
MGGGRVGFGVSCRARNWCFDFERGIYGSDSVGHLAPSSHPNRHPDMAGAAYRGALLCDTQVAHSTGGLLGNRLI